MQAVHLSKQFTVDVFSEHDLSNANTWSCIGRFDHLDDAINTCKKVVDGFLINSRGLFPNAEALALYYLNYGPAPCIQSVDNIRSFDMYDFLDQRCAELTQ